MRNWKKTAAALGVAMVMMVPGAIYGTDMESAKMVEEYAIAYCLDWDWLVDQLKEYFQIETPPDNDDTSDETVVDVPVATIAREMLEAVMNQYKHPFTAVIGEEARQKNMPNEMNYIMDYRLVHCLRNGLPLDQDVYDAAEWSCITELSELSVRQGSIPVEIPDFTRGNWR